MTEQVQADLVVIGAGPGGYAAAFRAADLGLSTVLVNAESRPGGVCLHRGCIPSKALLGLAERIFDAREAADWGVSFGEPTLDLDRIRAWGAKVIDRLAKGIEGLAKKRGVTLVQGRAEFADSTTLHVEQGPTVRFGKAIVATGSSPIVLPFMKKPAEEFWTSTEALALPYLPESLLVVGGGYIGLELATVYAGLGTEVTVVEATAGLLQGVDRDLVKPVHARMDKLARGGVHLETRVADVRREGPRKLVASFEGASDHRAGGSGAPPAGPERKEYQAVLVAVGRRPNTGALGLERTRVALDDKGFIRVDPQQRTADPAILAIGDVAGNPMLAHKAAKEGKVAAEVVAGHPAEFDAQAIPAVVFTDPEIAWTGLTEEEAARDGIEVIVGKFPWAASGRALASGRGDGVTKLVLEAATHRVLGLGIVGRGAGEMIAEGTLAVEMGALARDLAETIHPHPTLSETIMEAAEVAYGESTHVAPPRKAASRTKEAAAK